MTGPIRKVALLVIAAFIVAAVHLTYISLTQGEKLSGHPLNRRQAGIEQTIVRGGIFDRRGEQLAETMWQGSRRQRLYPQGRASAHIVGYDSTQYGKSGLEAAYNGELLGLTGTAKLENLAARLLGRHPEGINLQLTVDSRLQELAADMLKGRRGAVVAIEPRTGKVLVMASSPAFDPGQIDRQFAEVSRDPASPLLNRTLQGLYLPGSTMKVVTGAVALSQSAATRQGTILCPGYLDIEGRRLGDIKTHGQVDFDRAMAVSCNTYFGRLGLALGAKTFSRGAAGFGFNSGLAFDLPVRNSVFPDAGTLNANGLAEAAIGQGGVAATPLQMALVTAAIANDGVMMKPFLVQTLAEANGRVLRQTRPEVLTRSVDRDTARRVMQAMVGAVVNGTGRPAAIPGVNVAGKTGSAENPHGEPHAWFVGVAPAEQPRVAVAVVVENAGHGGAVAAPIAREIMIQVLNER